MPKLKPKTIIPTEEEDALINAGISSDPDSNELSDSFLNNSKPASEFFDKKTYSTLLALKKTRGRPKIDSPKVFTAIRLDADLVKTFKGTGKGWQTRVNAALRQFLNEHPIQEKEI
jgi:uncharacterized protein (DUF4415 family)